MSGYAEHGQLPLDGVRVCDFTWIVAGPQATRILADLGAEVVKVENESHLDSMRLGLQQDPSNPSINGSGFHSNFNRNKKGISANVHHPDGRKAVERLIAQSDVVIENFSAGALSRMGFDYERLKELRPNIIYVSMSGFGHEGRDSSYVTWGPTAQAVSGVTYMSGLPDQPPAGWGFSYLDHTAGYYGALATLIALHHRRRTGQGQHIDMSQVETGMVLGGVPILDYQINQREFKRIGNRSLRPSLAPHGMYRCAPVGTDDDRWIAIACEKETQWRAICGVLGIEHLMNDSRFSTNTERVEHQDELDTIIATQTREHDQRKLMYALQAVNVPAGAAQNMADKMEKDPQLRDRGFYQTAPHTELGLHRFEGFPAHFSQARWRLDRGAPTYGEDTVTVLRDMLGFSEAEIKRMQSELAV